jgi:hypothetical protein
VKMTYIQFNGSHLFDLKVVTLTHTFEHEGTVCKSNYQNYILFENIIFKYSRCRTCGSLVCT